MTLFVCSSVYQLMNALMIAMDDEKSVSDIIFLKNFEEIVDIQKLKQIHIFRNVYLWKGKLKTIYTDSNSHLDYLKQMILKVPVYLCPWNLIKTLPNKKESYSHIFVSYGDFPSQLIYFYFKKKFNADLSLYEDGTYTYECLETKLSIARYIYSKLFFGSCFFKECKNVYVYKTDELRLGGREDIKVFPINKNYDRVRKIFQEMTLNKNPYDKEIKGRIIIFDQNLEYENILQCQNKIAVTLTRVFSESNVCVKLHPGTKVIHYDNCVNINSSKLPFELFINSSITNDSILVSILSTACFNPKWMFDMEPYVILTYKIVNLDSVDFFDKQYYEVINRLKNSYREPDKIFIPENEAEMLEFIKKIL